jgi:vanillate O-demethylase monooxygenase subunit
MKEFTHWHPVYLSSELGEKPVSIQLHSQDILLFREKNGNVAAIKDECPHRRMKLSEGIVKENTIICPYHGWEIQKNGSCKTSTGETFVHKNPIFTTVERYGAIWIRLQNSATEFPIFDLDGFHKISVITCTVQSPLELVLDNFTETEHTSSVHSLLGFSQEELKNVEIRLESNESSVRLFNKGKQKPIPYIVRYFLQLKKSDFFIDDWSTYFSPIYSVYDQYWEDSKTNQKRKSALRIYVFFIPESKTRTKLITFTYMKYNKWGNFGLNLFIKPIMSYIVDLEVKKDKTILEKMKNQETTLSGCKLSKFDKALGLNRSRIQKVYY